MSTKSAKEAPTNIQARLCNLHAITHRRLKWSLRRLAREIRCNHSMLLQMMDGRRQPSPDMLGQIENAERNVSFALSEVDELDEMEREWLVAAVVRHAGEFTTPERKRIEQSLRRKS